MWYPVWYANTIICTPVHGGRAGHFGDRPPVCVRLYRTPLPDPPRPCRGAIDHHDCPQPALYRSDRAQRHSCVSPTRPRGAALPIVTPTHHIDHLRCWGLRVSPGPVTPESSDVRQAHEPLDAGAGRRGQFRPGPHPPPRQRRHPSAGPPSVGRDLEAGHTLDHQSRSRVCSKKNGATT
jgi:hypothetical protein